jgi:hypothetical protein
LRGKGGGGGSERERVRERERERIRNDTQRLARRVIARIEERDSGFQMTPPTSSEELRERPLETLKERKALQASMVQMGEML